MQTIGKARHSMYEISDQSARSSAPRVPFAGRAGSAHRANYTLHDFYENAPCGYHSVSSEGTILRMNRTELGWLGFTREDLVGTRKFADIVSSAGARAYDRAFTSLTMGSDVAELEAGLIRKNRSSLDAFLRIGVVRDARGTILHTRATVIDLTARKRAESRARAYAAQLEAVSSRIAETLEAERRDLSAELHDRLGQDLASIKLNLQVIKAQFETERQSGLGPRLDDSISLVERAVASVRCVAAALRPALLDDRGLAETLKSYCEQYSIRTGVRVLLAVKRPAARLEHDVAMTLFRITQEALTNVMKHAGAASARVTLAADAKSASLAIEDDGRGFDAGARATSVPNGLGLLIMEQRLRAVGGSLRVVSSPGTGTRVNATVRRMK